MQDIKEYKENHAKQNHIKGCSKKLLSNLNFSSNQGRILFTIKLKNDHFFCERRFCSVSALLSHEGPIKIDCQVRTSVRNGFPENIKHFPTFEWFTNMLFQYNQFLFPWENTRTQFSMGHSQSFQTKFRSMKVFQLVRLSWEKHAFFVKLRADDNSDAMNRL